MSPCNCSSWNTNHHFSSPIEAADCGPASGGAPRKVSGTTTGGRLYLGPTAHPVSNRNIIAIPQYLLVMTNPLPLAGWPALGLEETLSWLDARVARLHRNLLELERSLTQKRRAFPRSRQCQVPGERWRQRPMQSREVRIPG